MCKSELTRHLSRFPAIHPSLVYKEPCKSTGYSHTKLSHFNSFQILPLLWFVQELWPGNFLRLRTFDSRLGASLGSWSSLHTSHIVPYNSLSCFHSRNTLPHHHYKPSQTKNKHNIIFLPLWLLWGEGRSRLWSRKFSNPLGSHAHVQKFTQANSIHAPPYDHTIQWKLQHPPILYVVSNH